MERNIVTIQICVCNERPKEHSVVLWGACYPSSSCRHHLCQAISPLFTYLASRLTRTPTQSTQPHWHHRHLLSSLHLVRNRRSLPKAKFNPRLQLRSRAVLPPPLPQQLLSQMMTTTLRSSPLPCPQPLTTAATTTIITQLHQTNARAPLLIWPQNSVATPLGQAPSSLAHRLCPKPCPPARWPAALASAAQSLRLRTVSDINGLKMSEMRKAGSSASLVR